MGAEDLGAQALLALLVDRRLRERPPAAGRVPSFGRELLGGLADPQFCDGAERLTHVARAVADAEDVAVELHVAGDLEDHSHQSGPPGCTSNATSEPPPSTGPEPSMMSRSSSGRRSGETGTGKLQ